MSILLLKSLFPDSAPDTLKKITTLSKEQKQSINDERLKKIKEITKFFLQITVESADSILVGRYKDFDALIKNFGCQITALDIFLKIKDTTLVESAEKYKTLALEKLYLLEKDSSLQISSLQNSDSQLDFQVSSEFAHLCRYRVLSIVNTNIVKGGREIPITSCDKLIKKFPYLKTCKKQITDLVSTIQIEESNRAIKFIQNQAREINESNTASFEILQKSVSDSFIKEKGGISSVPLLFNTEIVFRRIQMINAIVLIKNKLILGENRREQATPFNIYFKGANLEILSEKDLDNLNNPPSPLPIVVIEAVINEDLIKSNEVIETIKTMGLISLVNGNALLPHITQYASKDSLTNESADDTVQRSIDYMDQFSPFKKEAALIEIDHIFCANLQEERQNAI